MEFTRLSQITGNMKYYSAVQRIVDELEKWQNKTALPGMWPAYVDATGMNQPISLNSSVYGSVEQFTLGALADSTYEYLPKVCQSMFSRPAVTFYSNSSCLAASCGRVESCTKFLWKPQRRTYFTAQ